MSPPVVKWMLAICGGGVLLFALLVLGFSATTPDVGLRFFLVDESEPGGPIIRAVTPGFRARGGSFVPQVGDRLLELGPSGSLRERRARIYSFLHFTKALNRLRQEPPLDGKLRAGANPSELNDLIPPFVEIETDHWLDRERWVEALFSRKGHTEPNRTWLLVQSLSLAELLVPLVWFLLELAIFTVGAIAFWTRPFDWPARVFFAMCVVTVGAFVGGYHWWVIAGTLWLNIPFAVCAVLVPAVTLHFFLIFPYPKDPIGRYPRITLLALYFPPVVSMTILSVLLCYCSWLFHTDVDTLRLQPNMEFLRAWIHGTMWLAAVYFALTLFSLIKSFVSTRDTLEHQQVAWILWAALISTIPVGYTFYLAQFNRVAFALGHGTLPMFFASLLFMLAYAIGIARHKLMLVDQFFSRETFYFVLSAVSTCVYSVLIAGATLTALLQHVRSSRQALVVAALLMVTVILVGWIRDRVQRLIDRKFYREKYQLDKALQKMNQMAGQLLDPDAVAERMLGSCREVLLVSRSALYFLDPTRQQFQLAAVDGQWQVPNQFIASDAMIAALRVTPSWQRHDVGSEEGGAVIHPVMRSWSIELLQALEVDGVVEGVVILGKKRTGTEYSAEDLTFLTAVGQVAGVAMHSARVHQVVGRLNEELQFTATKISEQQRQIVHLQNEISAAHTRVVPVKSLEVASAPVDSEFRCEQIRGSSPAMSRLLQTVRKVAGSDASVLIRGESGTGKELLAEAIHQNSGRKQGALIKVHCGALSAGLLESELFGHVKGAFTGAHQDKVGRFELANGGTLFLDEIGDISLETQIKLLRVLQEREFEKVGGTRTVQVDVRLITATHQNLEKLIREGKFREDLFYRLNVITITPPPLRERSEDIIELAMYFMTRAAQRLDKSIKHIEGEALERLKSYPWPGNIRELENAIERAVVLAEEERILVQDLPPEIWNSDASHGSGWDGPSRQPTGRQVTISSISDDVTSDTEISSQEKERQQLVSALHQCGGNKAEAARLLGMPRSTFFSKLKKHAMT